MADTSRNRTTVATCPECAESSPNHVEVLVNGVCRCCGWKAPADAR